MNWSRSFSNRSGLESYSSIRRDCSNCSQSIQPAESLAGRPRHWSGPFLLIKVPGLIEKLLNRHPQPAGQGERQLPNRDLPGPPRQPHLPRPRDAARCRCGRPAVLWRSSKRPVRTFIETMSGFAKTVDAEKPTSWPECRAWWILTDKSRSAYTMLLDCRTCAQRVLRGHDRSGTCARPAFGNSGFAIAIPRCIPDCHSGQFNALGLTSICRAVFPLSPRRRHAGGWRNRVTEYADPQLPRRRPPNAPYGPWRQSGMAWPIMPRRQPPWPLPRRPVLASASSASSEVSCRLSLGSTQRLRWPMATHSYGPGANFAFSSRLVVYGVAAAVPGLSCFRDRKPLATGVR